MKIRFFVLQDKRERQILSAELDKSGDVRIYPYRGDVALFGGKRLGKPQNRKISIHNSRDAITPSHVVTHEITFRQRLPHRGYARFKKSPHGSFLWLIMVSFVGTDREKPIKLQSSDIIVKLLAYTSSNNTLACSLFVSNKGFKMAPIYGASIISKDIGEFTLHIVANFAHVKSPNRTLDTVIYTTQIRSDNLYILGEPVVAENSLTNDIVKHSIQQALEAIIHYYRRNFRRLHYFYGLYSFGVSRIGLDPSQLKS